MGQFSDDGLWWWDGTTWIATAKIVLPQLPMTEFEQLGKLKGARRLMRLLPWNTSINLGVILFFPWLAAMRNYRSWRLEQLALSTAYLVGPREAMLACESSFPITGSLVPSDLAVVVTGAHVLVFGIDSLDGQPRWVALAGRPTDVNMELRSSLFGLYPSLLISGGNGRWRIRGVATVFRPGPVLEAWRQAATTTASNTMKPFGAN